MRYYIIEIRFNKFCLIVGSFLFSLLILIGMTALPSEAYQNKREFNYPPEDLSNDYNWGGLKNLSNLSNRSARTTDLNYGPPLTFPSPGFYPPISSTISPFGLFYGPGGGLPFYGGYGFGRPPLLALSSSGPPLGGLGGIVWFWWTRLRGVRKWFFSTWRHPEYIFRTESGGSFYSKRDGLFI